MKQTKLQTLLNLLTDPENQPHQFFDDADALKAFLEEAQTEDFKTASMPLIKYLAENKHPHHTAIVTAINAELLEGKESTGTIIDYLRD